MTEPVVGVVGGGQLARMLAEAATPMGVHLRVLAAPSDEGAAAVVPDTVVGSPDDADALRRFAATVDVLTFDHENVDHAVLRSLEEDGVAVRPSVRTLEFSDKAHQRRAFAAAGLPVPEFVVLDGGTDPVAAAAAFAAAPRRCGGGQGQPWWVRRPGRVDAATATRSATSWPTGAVPRWSWSPAWRWTPRWRCWWPGPRRARSGSWPVLETVQVDGMCDEVILPAPIDAGLRRPRRADRP